ncbi:hypothetical protein RM533_10345 [Croceicoccus sp. F390]|uniref:Heme exporter protein D n=1 Tax=Croceicoccus esteveae TaxID=3075597 RepID=A0ABU2ZIZ8_9SPHN|nr:hypothetical protein [Croceicoccus sp. F390]MDT0576582.1 hypothetical protein [Croceicoccus sp. F390]
MNEGLQHWPFVIAAYAIGVCATLAMVAWSWFGMKRAEQRREEVRRK